MEKTMDKYAETTNIESSKALWWGIAFSFAFTGLIWLVGEYGMDPGRFASFCPR